MPTVLRRGSLRVVIYPNDHRPAHAHVVGQSIEAVFNLHCPEGPVELREAVGLNLSKAQRLASWIESEITVLCARWRNIHGYH